MSTDVNAFINDLDAGVFAEKLGRALSDVAAGVVDNQKAGKVTMTFDVKQIGNSHQVTIDHKLSFNRPTKRGKVSEEDATKTPMHVGVNGKLSLFPEDQHQMFTAKGKVNEDA